MRQSVAILLAAVVAVAMCVALWRYVGDASGGGQVVLVDVSGAVTLSGPGRDGEASPGVTIRAEDRLSTKEGRAVLALDGGTRVRIGPSSSVVVRSVDADGVGLELEGGALKATVRPEGGSVNVTGAGVTVAAIDADFAIGVADGVAIVETRRGDVGLMGADRARLTEGSRAVFKERIAAVAPIPEDLLLSVVWPAPARTREEQTEVTGRTDPGARVVLTGGFGERTVLADREGRFRALVPLVEGENELVVKAVGLLGKAANVRGVLQTRDTRGPLFQGGVEYGN